MVCCAWQQTPRGDAASCGSSSSTVSNHECIKGKHHLRASKRLRLSDFMGVVDRYEKDAIDACHLDTTSVSVFDMAEREGLCQMRSEARGTAPHEWNYPEPSSDGELEKTEGDSR